MGQLEKLKITAYTDDTFSDSAKIDEEFMGLVNPENYQESVSISYNDCQPLGTSGNDLKFNKTIPGTLTLKLLFDSTGVFPQDNSVTDEVINAVASSTPVKKKDDEGVYPQIKKFQKLTFHLNGTIHEPNYLKVNWGSMDVQCRLTKIDTDYKIFNSSGYPIRAIVTLTLEKILSKTEREALENKKSPDLTHIRFAVAGDTLPWLTYLIYGDPKYYLKVAEINKIMNFRRLTPGQKIIFPPLQKTNE